MSRRRYPVNVIEMVLWAVAFAAVLTLYVVTP